MQEKSFTKETLGNSFRQTYMNNKNNYIIVVSSVWDDHQWCLPPGIHSFAWFNLLKLLSSNQ